jgi:hypothetical protein
MNELEEMISLLQNENQHLVSENENLRRTTVTLFEENKQLKQRLGMTSDSMEVKPEFDVVTRKLSDSVTEPAVLATPLPQEGGRTSIQLTAAYYLAWLTLLWLAISYLARIHCLVISSNVQLLANEQIVCLACLLSCHVMSCCIDIDFILKS